ncbi:RING-type E3 ubiquitin transferase [Ranunculus cassubicifolius]
MQEVAILEFPGFYEVGSSTDRHRDMRLDIDDMSYEELLALGERIGNVVTGFPKETISSHLKTKVYHSTTTKDTNNETETCTVCQVEFKDAEKVGSLDCGHEYHVDCIKRWLQVKNVCPICKVPAINVEK